jgi:hypothetical protein
MTTTTSASNQSGMLRCARHPNTETSLRCGRCETPICPQCMIMSPVGARCPTCAQVKRFALMLKPMEVVRAVVFGIGVAAIGTIVLVAIPFLQILGLFAYAALGYGVGTAVSVGANRKRVPVLAPIAVACLFLGYGLAIFVQLLVIGAPIGFALSAPILTLLNGLNPAGLLRSPLLGLLLGALLAWMRNR